MGLGGGRGDGESFEELFSPEAQLLRARESETMLRSHNSQLGLYDLAPSHFRAQGNQSPFLPFYPNY